MGGGNKRDDRRFESFWRYQLERVIVMEIKKTRAAVLTPAAVSFKRNYGKRNHNLVTSIVGLEILRTEGNNQINSGVSTVVNFNDKVPAYLENSWVVRNDMLSHSINSAMQYVLFSSLNLLVDAVDCYLKELSLVKNLLPDSVNEDLNNRARGMKDRHEKIETYVFSLHNKKTVDKLRLTIDSKLLHLSRQLRNGWIHSDERTIIPNLLEELLPYKDMISATYKHFSPWITCARFAEKSPLLTLKDVASLWASAERFVEQVDSMIIEENGIKETFSLVLSTYFLKQVQDRERDKDKQLELQRGCIRKFLNAKCDKIEPKLKAILEQEAGFNRQWDSEDLLKYPLGSSISSYFQWVLIADKSELEQHLMGTG